MLRPLKSVLFAVLCSCALGACVSKNMETQASAFQFGNAPTSEQIQAMVPAYFHNILLDPFSAQYQYGAPYKGELYT